MNDVIFHRRGLAWTYYILTISCALLALALLALATQQALDHEPWRSKGLSVFLYVFAALSWLIGIGQMWMVGRKYARSFVRLDGSGLSLVPPSGELVTFAFHDVRAVRWNPALRSKQCTVEMDSGYYVFDPRSCPRVGRVAELIAERSRLTLQIETQKN